MRWDQHLRNIFWYFYVWGISWVGSMGFHNIWTHFITYFMTHLKIILYAISGHRDTLSWHISWHYEHLLWSFYIWLYDIFVHFRDIRTHWYISVTLGRHMILHISWLTTYFTIICYIFSWHMNTFSWYPDTFNKF